MENIFGFFPPLFLGLHIIFISLYNILIGIGGRIISGMAYSEKHEHAVKQNFKNKRIHLIKILQIVKRYCNLKIYNLLQVTFGDNYDIRLHTGQHGKRGKMRHCKD